MSSAPIRSTELRYCAQIVISIATDGVDLLKVIGPDGVTTAAYGYDTNHNVLFMTNALGEVTSYSYNADAQILSITTPSGLITTNSYHTTGVSSRSLITLSSVARRILPDQRLHLHQRLVFTHTDERGLTVTNSWDSLQRLTNVAYPDGTHIAYIYTRS